MSPGEHTTCTCTHTHTPPWDTQMAVHCRLQLLCSCSVMYMYMTGTRTIFGTCRAGTTYRKVAVQYPSCTVLQQRTGVMVRGYDDTGEGVRVCRCEGMKA